MPPKTSSGASKKTVQEKKKKVIEDKTFGLKNKKGAKNQKFIQQVQNQVQQGGNAEARKLEEKKRQEKLKKEEEEKRKKEMNDLFKPVQKVEKGADPKSILCAFFKQGTCGKGNKCKFSHDLAVERKGEKRSIYVDMRDDTAEQSGDWNETKLQEVVEMKHGEANKKIPTTNIICRYFLNAVENNKYGWFWECPNGASCIYKHALPPGFTLKKDKKKDDSTKAELSIEDLVERERANLGPNQTKVTLSTFLAWKRRKLNEKEEQIKKDVDRKKAEYKAGRNFGLSGREMFTFNPDMAADDGMDNGDEAVNTAQFEREDDDTNDYKEINLEELSAAACESEGGGTQAPQHRKFETDDATPSTAGQETIQIDEALFELEDDDLEDLEEELKNLGTLTAKG